ncbi:unnamed protein product [Hymenolepis diminuta]|uniref:Uncharacterized protein n=1 Tax=Hymenolepis diminuta TaxID=6216 RepID=A0A564Y067_HYMDI|nr:unnamed protein product [Hymenolepis diminuta]
MDPSLYFSLLPSEVCRLVLGFLMDSGCLQAANVFLHECRYLSELREVLQRTPNASFRLPGFTFDDVLRDYIDVVNALNDKRDKSTLGFGPSDIPICRPGSAIASLRYFLFEFTKSRKEVSTQCDSLPKSFTTIAPKILFPSNQQGRHIFIRHSTPRSVNPAGIVAYQSANVGNLSINATQMVPSVPQIPLIVSRSVVTAIPDTTQVSGTSEFRKTVAVIDTTQFDNAVPGDSGPEVSYTASISTNDKTENVVMEHGTPELQTHNNESSVTNQDAATTPRSHDPQIIPFVTSPAGSNCTLDLEVVKTPELQIQHTVTQNVSNVSSTGSSRRKPLRVQRSSSTTSNSSQFNYVLDAERVLFSVAAHAETLACKINSCLAPREEALVFNGLNDSDYDEILNMLEEDFNIVSDADLTDLLDTFDPFSIEDPNLPLPVLPPPDTTSDTVTSESSVENPENAPKELSPKPQTSVRKPKCARKKSIPRKRITTVFEDFFEFPSNASNNLLEGSENVERVSSPLHADSTGITQPNPTEPAANVESVSPNSDFLTGAKDSENEKYTVNSPTVTQFVDLDQTPIKKLPKKFSTNSKLTSPAQAGPSVKQIPRPMEIELKSASVSQGEAPQAHVGLLEIQTPRTMEIASALVSLSLVEPSQSQSGSSRSLTPQRKEIASKPISMSRDGREKETEPSSRGPQRKEIAAKPVSMYQRETWNVRPSSSRRRRTTSKRTASTHVKSKFDKRSSKPTITQSSSSDETLTKPFKRPPELELMPSSKRQKCEDGRRFVPNEAYPSITGCQSYAVPDSMLTIEEGPVTFPVCTSEGYTAIESVNEFVEGSQIVTETGATAENLPISQMSENLVNLSEVAESPNSACAMEADAVDNLSSCQMSGTTSTFVPELYESSGSTVENQHSYVETSTTSKVDSSQRPTAAPESLENPPSFGSLPTTSSEAVTSNQSPREMIEYSIPIQVLYQVSDTTGEASQSGQSAYMCSLNTAPQVIQPDVPFQIVDLSDPEVEHFPTEPSPGSPTLSKSRLLQHIKTMKQNVGESFSSSLQSQTPCRSSVRTSVPVTPVQQLGPPPMSPVVPHQLQMCFGFQSSICKTPLQSPRLIVRIPKDVVKGCGEMTSQELLRRALQQQIAVSSSAQIQQEQTVSAESTQVLQERRNSLATTPIRQMSIPLMQQSSLSSSPNPASVKENVFPSSKCKNKVNKG